MNGKFVNIALAVGPNRSFISNNWYSSNEWTIIAIVFRMFVVEIRAQK